MAHPVKNASLHSARKNLCAKTLLPKAMTLKVTQGYQPRLMLSKRYCLVEDCSLMHHQSLQATEI